MRSSQCLSRSPKHRIRTHLQPWFIFAHWYFTFCLVLGKEPSFLGCCLPRSALRFSFILSLDCSFRPLLVSFWFGQTRPSQSVSVPLDFAFTLYQGIEWACWHGHLSSYAQELKTVRISWQGSLDATENCASHEVTPDQKSREISQTPFFDLFCTSVRLPQNSKFLLCRGRDALTLSLIRNPLYQFFFVWQQKRYPQCAGRWKRQWTCVYVMNHRGYDRPQLQQHVSLTSHSLFHLISWFQKARSLQTFDWL